MPSSPDHPRACGANADNGQTVATRNGSSPRVRGKLARSAQVGHGVRIIPARAGQTVRPVCAMPSSPDHPRACGANVGECCLAQFQSGSSPRVRGKPRPTSCPGTYDRIIPARAGQTFVGRGMQCSGTDHPRACGANPMLLSSMPYQSGSSPRVRGKPVIQRVHVDLPRIIPARAGQTCPRAAR